MLFYLQFIYILFNSVINEIANYFIKKVIYMCFSLFNSAWFSILSSYSGWISLHWIRHCYISWTDAYYSLERVKIPSCHFFPFFLRNEMILRMKWYLSLLSSNNQMIVYQFYLIVCIFIHKTYLAISYFIYFVFC